MANLLSLSLWPYILFCFFLLILLLCLSILFIPSTQNCTGYVQHREIDQLRLPRPTFLSLVSLFSKSVFIIQKSELWEEMKENHYRKHFYKKKKEWFVLFNISANLPRLVTKYRTLGGDQYSWRHVVAATNQLARSVAVGLFGWRVDFLVSCKFRLVCTFWGSFEPRWSFSTIEYWVFCYSLIMCRQRDSISTWYKPLWIVHVLLLTGMVLIVFFYSRSCIFALSVVFTVLGCCVALDPPNLNLTQNKAHILPPCQACKSLVGSFKKVCAVWYYIFWCELIINLFSF